MEANHRRGPTAEDKMRTFNKVDFLISVGFLNARYNPNSQKFESSFYLRLKCCLHTLLKATFPLKMFVSPFFAREDPIQLYFGSTYNFLDDLYRKFFGFACLIGVLWMSSLYWIFNHMNARNDYDLFLKWMRISGEQPTEIGNYVVGLSGEELLEFCRKERNFNFFWYRVVSCGTLVLCMIFYVALFLLPSDTSWCIYVLVQAFNMFHLTYSIFNFLHSVYTTNIFVLQTIHLFSLKFRYIERHLTRLGATQKINNGHLARLILEFNRVQLELLEANDFFKNFLGTNIIFYFIMAVQFMFLSIFLDWLLRVALLLIMFALFLTVILVPFSFADSIPIQRGKTRCQLENLSFNRSVGVQNRAKIDTISHLSHTVGFTCFDWFLLDSNKALLLSLELIIYILLLIATYYLSAPLTSQS